MAGFIFFTVGRKGSGKSLYESRRALEILNGYYKTERRYPDLKKRIYFSKQKFAERIEKVELVSEENPNGHLYYWHSAYDLLRCPRLNCWKGEKVHPLHNADVFWDEIADDIPREKWSELPEDIKQIFSHARKRGVRIFANTQKYEMVAIDFRRQCDEAVWLVKVMGSRDIDVSLPDPKRVWVLQIASHFDPLDMENENDPRNLSELRIGWPKLHWYTRKDVSIFDTQWEVPPTVYNLYREMYPKCVNHPHCADPDGRWHEVKHVKL